MSIVAINPATDARIAEYPSLGSTEIQGAVRRAHRAFTAWRDTGFAERAERLREVARLLRADASTYARLMAEEMGKPVSGGAAEVEKCAWVCEYYAEQAETFLQPEIIPTDASKSFVTFQPLGVVLAVMPWNFPFWQVFRFAAPALMAGNTGVLKHASNVPGCALAIEDVFRQAGFPEHAFRTLLIG
ncbi:MAG: aldehyde dehydrogenase family protein, partial [bacterium]